MEQSVLFLSKCHIQDITSRRKIHFSHGEADEVGSLDVDPGSIRRARVQTRSFGVIHVQFKWIYREHKRARCLEDRVDHHDAGIHQRCNEITRGKEGRWRLCEWGSDA